MPYMFYHFCKKALVLFSSLLVTGSMWAAVATGTFEGFVKDVNGVAIQGAEIRIQEIDGKHISKHKTDAKGHYVSAALPSGIYKVDLVLNSKIRAYLKDAKLTTGKPTELNFDFKSGKIKKRYWVKETGSNLGRWVEEDDRAGIASTHNMIRADVSAVRKMQDRGSAALGQ